MTCWYLQGCRMPLGCNLVHLQLYNLHLVLATTLIVLERHAANNAGFLVAVAELQGMHPVHAVVHRNHETGTHQEVRQ